jgi:tRNA pseudouridine32 synthase/23S rRNA pseudouridine746 synthase/23S rRNA pseudouridine1911/1915/1917 synthase
MTPAEIQARVLYRDNLILIIDKPAGLPVHGGPGGGDHLEKYFDALRFGLPRPPALAHRLDHDTSGCLALGRNSRALGRLGRLFEARKIDKIYWAIVEGTPPEPAGRIELALRKETRKTGWRMAADPKGLAAITDYRLLAGAKGRSLLELIPRTGRTHQVRIHCAALGCPIVGDSTYGAGQAGEPMQLHARALTIPLYADQPPITAKAPPPPHMADLLREMGFDAFADSA